MPVSDEAYATLMKARGSFRAKAENSVREITSPEIEQTSTAERAVVSWTNSRARLQKEVVPRRASGANEEKSISREGDESAASKHKSCCTRVPL